MSAAIRIEVAREKIAKMSDAKLKRYSDCYLIWKLAQHISVPLPRLEILISREQLKRGFLKMADLPPALRREMVDPENIDVRSLANGPIMDPANIYLPAGKLSMAETREREARQKL